MWLFSISYILSNTSLVRRNYWILPCNITFISWLQRPAAPPALGPFFILVFFFFLYSWVGGVLIQYWFLHRHSVPFLGVLHVYHVLSACSWSNGGAQGLGGGIGRPAESVPVFIVLVGSCQRWHSETFDPLKWIHGQSPVTEESNSFPENVRR